LFEFYLLTFNVDVLCYKSVTRRYTILTDDSLIANMNFRLRKNKAHANTEYCWICWYWCNFWPIWM